MICGDFNSQPRNSVSHGGAEGAYKLLTSATLSAGHPDHPASPKPPILWAPARDAPAPLMSDLHTSGLQLRSAYKGRSGRGADEELPFTTRTTPFTGVLDYIFTSENAFEVMDTLSLPRQEFMPNGMPTTDWPSDHFALVAKIRIRK